MPFQNVLFSIHLFFPNQEVQVYRSRKTLVSFKQIPATVPAIGGREELFQRRERWGQSQFALVAE